MVRLLSTALAVSLFVPATAPRAQDELGLGRMWTFENPPLAWLQKEYGFAPTQAWLDLVRLASLRFGNGCSASFVSPHGLILTNHHCARGAIASAQGEHDWVTHGFVAADRSAEVQLGGLTVQQLVAMRDVTTEIDAGVGAGTGDSELEAARKANQERVLAAAKSAQPELTHQVVALFHGAIWQLYSYKVYDDVRLVMAPHLQAAHFGGDFDNFTYPRYAIDFALCRAYEDGKPADTTQHWFRMRADGAQQGDLTFVVGNPGRTERQLTKAQLEYLRDARHPRIRQLIDNRLRIMRELAAADPAAATELQTAILSLENAQKAYRGMHTALLDEKFLGIKEAAEARLRERVGANQDWQTAYGDLWDRIADLAARQTRLEGPLNFHTGGGSLHLDKAIAIVRAVVAEEPAERERNRELLQQGIPTDMKPQQTAFFVDHLERAQEWLPPVDPYLRVLLQGGSAAAAADRIAGSRVADADFTAKLLEGGADAIATSEDPAIAAARVIVPLSEANQRANRDLQAQLGALSTRLGRALFDVYGRGLTPDATFTLRFSDGRVAGYEYNGTVAPWRTTFWSMFGRHVEFGGKHPFDLPQPWLDVRDRIDLDRAVNFVTTCDTTGGNSGSPVVDREARLVGLLFDGNIESLPNDFYFREQRERSVCVHPQAILESLRVVYGAGHLADELVGEQR